MHCELEQYTRIADFLAETLGSTFDVGLFDLSDPNRPECIAGNSESGIVEKVRAFIAGNAGSHRAQTEGCLTNHPLETGGGKLVKLSVYFIRKPEGTLIGALWISMRCDLFLKMNAFVNSMLQFNLTDAETEDGNKTVPMSAQKASLDLITQTVEEFGVEPGRISLAERQEIICDLYDLGVYNLKGAVAKTAEVLQVSEQSVYRYVAKIKKARDW